MDSAVFDVIHADTLRFFPDLVADLGGDPNTLFAESGVGPSALPEGTSAYGYRLIVDLLEHAARALECPDFGLRLAAVQGGGRVFGPMGVVMRNSETLGDALEYVSSHPQAHSLAARVRMERNGDGSVFVGHEILLDRMRYRPQAMEQFLLLAHLNAMEITGGRARVRAAHFRHQPVSPLPVYRRYFGCAVHFDQREDGVVFADRDLRSRTVDPDPSTYRTITSQLDADFASAAPPMSAQVRGVVLQYIGTQHCTNERVAAALHLHPRTLHRRLTAEGTSFHAVKDAVRRDLALYYLQKTDFDLTRIAERIGYSEHSVLTRSCQRWFATTPRTMR
jgi:AraC-like DNA-binding protein